MSRRRLVLAAALCALMAAAYAPGLRRFTGKFQFERKSLAQASSGVVYVGSNIGHEAGKNSILAFRRN